MTETRPNPIIRLMPSLTDVAFLMPLAFLFARLDGVRTLLSDGDTGWHIRTGEWILANGRVPDKDLFSFSMPGQPWFAWEWLWDVGAALLHRSFGLGGVVFASMLVICFTFGLLFRVVNRRCGNPILAIAMTLLAAAGASIHWLARPHLFTLFFAVVFLAILERVRDGRTKLLWTLPVLTVLWTNLHAGFPVGILILCSYGAGDLLASLVASKRAAGFYKAPLAYFATAAGCLAASLINPYFYHLQVHIYRYLGDSYTMNNILEFQSANFRSGAAGFLEAMLVLGLGAAIWFGTRKRFAEAILLGGWAHLALLSARNIPIFMIVAAPVAAQALTEWFTALSHAPVAGWLRNGASTIQAIAEETTPMDRLWRLHVFPVFVFAVLGLAMASPDPGLKFKPEYDPKAYPAGALAKLSPAQRIFTHDEWGDYLIYRLSPNGTRVFVDGRSDYYGEKFCLQYLDLMKVKYDWEQILARYGVDTILLPTDTALAGAVKESSHWRTVYDDGLAIVFRPALRAAGTGEQTSTSSTGGRERDRSITQVQHVISKDHVSQLTGANPL